MTDKLRAAAEIALEYLEMARLYAPPIAFGNSTIDDAIYGLRKEMLSIDSDFELAKNLESEMGIVGWMYEDQLPEIYPYEEMFPFSVVDGVRMFPVYAPKAEPDTGIDRGAWSDVPDATKWVDELRGDEPEFECPRCGHCCQFVEPPDSTTDVVESEPVAWVKLDEGMIISHAELSYGSGVDMDLSDWTPLYAAPPKREWQGLTDEEIEEGYEQSWVESKQAWESAVWWAEAKLKEKNDANHV